MYVLTLFVAAGCFMAAVVGLQGDWPWWSVVLLLVGAVVFVVADTDTED